MKATFKTVVGGEEYKTLGADRIAKMLREDKSLWILRGDETVIARRLLR
jgi:hypothetical protein